MKISTKKKSFEAVMALPKCKHHRPLRPNFLLQTVVRVGAIPDLWSARFSYTEEGMDAVKKQPCLILMNHSSFIDLKIVSKIFYPRRYGIVCTSDGFIGKEWLMRFLGCIPTQKFVSDITLIRDMEYMLKKKKAHVLMYPEASYSFDGTATPLPRKMGVLLKKLGVPVVMVTTSGAFTREPLYNNLKKRKNVGVTAHVKCLFTAQQIKELSVRELDEGLDQAFTFDHFTWQKEQNVRVTDATRAEGLERILYKCSDCGAEGEMHGDGTTLTCGHCGKVWQMDELGQLSATEGETKFPHIPDWYAWERQQVRQELENGTYRMDAAVDIAMMVDYKAIYQVGEGRLTHDENGFHLTGCDGKLDYTQGPLASHSLNSDYYWYKIGDMISIGNREALYYCFPKNSGDVVAKTRLAAEELYKMKRARKPRVSE